ncbi:MAG: hypothetical protein ABIS01_01605 [Ferruginibacter sp.]
MVNTINTQKKDVFMMEEGVNYLNCLNMPAMFVSVKNAGIKGLETSSEQWKLSSADWFINAKILRVLAAQIFQPKYDNIALVPLASYGIAIAAKNLQPDAGKEIIRLEHQIPPNYYAWEHLANYRKEYREGARKFDMGEFPHINLMPMSIAALEQILK